jgi:hypothetical protein
MAIIGRSGREASSPTVAQASTFGGHGQNPKLILDDHGSLTNAFQPDGSVYKGHDHNRPYATKGAEFTAAEGSYSDFKSACGASWSH